MGNIVEFIIKMRDGLSSPLKKAGKEVDSTTNGFNRLLASNKRLQVLMGTTANSATDLKAKIQKLQEFRDLLPASSTKNIRKINDEIETLTGKISKIETMKSGKGIKGYFSDLVSQIPPILTNPIVAIGAGIGFSINKGLENSKTKLELSNLVGKDSGNALYKSLSGIKSMLGDETFDFGKKILNSGVAVDKVTSTLKSLGNIANGDKAALANVVDAFSEMRVEGKFTEEGFKKFGMLGFNPLQQISKTTGESMAKLTQRMDDGKISVAEIEKAMEGATSQGGQFYGNLERINNSPQGKWNSMIAKISKFGGMIGEYLMPLITSVVDTAVDGFGWLSDKISMVLGWLKPLTKSFAEFKGIIGLVASVLGGLAIGIWAVTAAKTAWGTITEWLTLTIESMSASIMAIPVFGWILAGIAAVIAAVMYLRSHFEGFGRFFKNLWSILKATFTYTVSGFKQGFDSISYYVQLLWLKLKSFGQYVGQLFTNIGESLSLAAQFKFSEAKAKLTATITTEASKEIKQLDKDHAAKQDGYMKEQMTSLAVIALTPLKGIIKAKKEDPNAATDQAFGDSKGRSSSGSTTNTAKVDQGINAISGGGVKNIYVTVNKMIENSYITVTQETKQAARDLERLIEEGMVRAIASASAR
jgi:hypothetical protein